MRIVAISDLHVGSDVALADPKYAGKRGKGAPIRAALFDLWQQAVHGKWTKPDVLIVCGDAVEGQNRKQSGIGIWSTDLIEQADHATDLIRMWGAKRIYMVRGSGYHVDAANSGLQVEEYIARNLNAEEYPNQEHIDPEHRDRSGFDWYLDLDGVVFHCSHKISVSKVFHYQSTPTARQMLQARLNDRLRHEVTAQGKIRKIQVILRGHAHYYNTVGFSGSEGYVLPCWKALDDWMLGNGPLDISPDIGFLGFETNHGTYTREKNLWSLGNVAPPPLVVVGGGKGKRPANRRAAKHR
jgi:3',5'-cyclic AMP phosphodiesterase CpdA